MVLDTELFKIIGGLGVALSTIGITINEVKSLRKEITSLRKDFEDDRKEQSKDRAAFGTTLAVLQEQVSAFRREHSRDAKV